MALNQTDFPVSRKHDDFVIQLGQQLRLIRTRMSLTTRDVEVLTNALAFKKQRPDLYICHAHLSEIENGHSAPSSAKLYSLSVVYGLDIFALYGVDIRRIQEDRLLLDLPCTTILSVPQQDSSFQRIARNEHRDDTILFRMAIELPKDEASDDRLIYARIGAKDYTMWPMLRPGAVVQVDTSARTVKKEAWRSEYHRSLHLVDARSHYVCSWCELIDHKIQTIPHPLSPCQSKTYSIPQDAEVVGTVVGIASKT